MIIGGTEKKDTFFFEIVVQLDAQIDKSEGGHWGRICRVLNPNLVGTPCIIFLSRKMVA